MASLLLITNLLLIIIFPPVSSYRNVTLNSSITAKSDHDTPTWTSPSGEFAFGFRQVEGGGFLLAIWFDQIPEKTIVWTANRDNPVPSGSRVVLSETLELLDQRWRQVWTSKVVGSGALAYAAMLDTGNFVLATSNSMMLWQSFNSPTDTLLPGQTLNLGGVLISSFSETNYSKGRFILNTVGQLGLYTRDFPLDNDMIYPYWSQDSDSSPYFPLIFNLSGNIYVATQNGTPINPFNGEPLPVETFSQRLTLGFDGVFRHYVYPKSGNSTGGRPMAWLMHAFIPQDICMGVNQGGNGGGICGFNSHCSVGTDSDRKTVCKCPKGYVLVDPIDSMGDFELQSCDPHAYEADLFEFSEFPNTNFPYSDYRRFQPVEEDYCRQDCLADCMCAVAAYAGGTCWKKQLPMINGRTHPRISVKSFVKMRKNGTFARSHDNNLDELIRPTQSKSLFLTSLIMLATSIVAFLLSLVFFFQHRVKSEKVRVLPGGMTLMRSFSFTELQEITDGFKNELGRGACAKVYRGDLKESRQVVAVKKLDKISQESNLEFMAEVRSISKTHHKNLVQLLGYCDEGQYRILVYEFMPHGSLANFLFENSSRPDWYRRVQIAFAIARGLCYLHEDCITPIIHCDIKPQNVLLDESYTPKIADFGLAKLLRPDQTKTTTGIRGTRGYVAPEWFRNMPITVKVDVYSFGILLLELLCCRKNYIPDIDDERKMVLADWVYDCYQEGALELLVAEEDEAKNDIRSLERFVLTAIWCIQEDPALRPHMKRALHMLQGSVEVPVPPNPTIFIN